jgi:hypothetical protein
MEVGRNWELGMGVKEGRLFCERRRNTSNPAKNTIDSGMDQWLSSTEWRADIHTISTQ